MRNTLTRAIKIVFNAETILPFFVGSVCLGVLGNAIYDGLKRVFGESGLALAQIGLTAALVLLGAIAAVFWLISRQIASLPDDIPLQVRKKQLDRQYPGLILLVSHPQSCETAIRHHLPTLQRCWLISSLERLNLAKDLQSQYPHLCVDEPLVVTDVYDPLEFRDRVNDIYQMCLPPGWQEQDVIADYTGMTAHASVGTVLACVNTARPLQYIPAKLDPQTGKPIGSLPPIKITLGAEAV
ncbi:hypothetical protein [Thermoleptolyngbya sp. M55_K2018_002]|uniref:hypothetical protein n=1 Tax=Thermoleptolyngbya sp. M55_K2018_002 TaxID=2747808 RepID=UPI0019E10C60|nr:hypothetical protein [Thermoleptolyngbya sp. M55_K2018_002]HIK38995.1 CRISPR-associated protein [Thermoleptolyngbya sp. M55_K2018_002]